MKSIFNIEFFNVEVTKPPFRQYVIILLDSENLSFDVAIWDGQRWISKGGTEYFSAANPPKYWFFSPSLDEAKKKYMPQGIYDTSDAD